MLAALTLQGIIDRSRDQLGAGSRCLLSILMTMPSTAPFATLRNNVAYFNARSGDSWHLHVAGYYASGGGAASDPNARPVGVSVHGETEWWFSPLAFDSIRREIQARHETQIKRAKVFRRRRGWKYSGGPEIVSLWVTASGVDWESLVAYSLTTKTPLEEVVEIHADWPKGELPVEFRPGDHPYFAWELLRVDSIRRSLLWVSTAAAGAALNEGVTVLINELARHR